MARNKVGDRAGYTLGQSDHQGASSGLFASAPSKRNREIRTIAPLSMVVEKRVNVAKS
jgi:hypothetical protein